MGYFHENHAKRDQTWVLEGHIMLKGTRPLKINVKGTLYLNWILKGQFHDIFLINLA